WAVDFGGQAVAKAAADAAREVYRLGRGRKRPETRSRGAAFRSPSGSPSRFRRVPVLPSQAAVRQPSRRGSKFMELPSTVEPVRRARQGGERGRRWVAAALVTGAVGVCLSGPAAAEEAAPASWSGTALSRHADDAHIRHLVRVEG